MPKQPSVKLRVHLGCGARIIPGWTNVDIQPGPGVDIVADARALPFPDNSVDIIYASHLLEHFTRASIRATLREWHGVLKAGGTLRLAVPDFRACCEIYRKEESLDPILGLLYGKQDTPFNAHHIAFDEILLRDTLERAGFVKIRPWDWRATEHAAIDDFSQAYWPHMDKEHGRLMSLNLEATKP